MKTCIILTCFLVLIFTSLINPAYSISTSTDYPIQLPILNWEPRSDWLDVKSFGATGDGITDDTAAIQKALDQVKDGSTVYLPAGTYRITKMLTLYGPLHGISIIGHGRTTVLVWDGEIGGKMFMDDGIAYSRYVGITFNGKNKAAIGFWHYSDRRFETEVRHQHLAFTDFTTAGILADPNDKYALAETTFENCLFVRCKYGVSFTQFNDYDFTFDGCEFVRSEVAIYCEKGNFYIRDCHFEASSSIDIYAYPEHGSSIRRCTSNRSRTFTMYYHPVAPMTIQDCNVSNWKNTEGAVLIGGAPVIMFDCMFSNPPGPNPPVKIVTGNQKMIVSRNMMKPKGDVFYPANIGKFYSVDEGPNIGSIKSATKRFINKNVKIPGKVFDAKRDFGAKGDGITDDTAAIRKTIDKAREYGKGAIAYMPTGTYIVTDTIKITGKDYYVGGSGWFTRLLWKGKEGGTTVEVKDPLNITLENINVGSHDVGESSNAVDISQIGSENKSVMRYDGVWTFGMYQKQPFRKGFRFTGLGKNSTVIMPHVNGNIRFTDCAQAEILVNCSYEGSVIADGKSLSRSGLLGFQTRLATQVEYALYLMDNQSIIMSDFYIEQADNAYNIQGSSELPAGRATIQGAKLHMKQDKGTGVVLNSDNYRGQIFIGHQQFYIEPKNMRFIQTGDLPIDVYIFASSFYDIKPDISKQDNGRFSYIGNSNFGMMNVQYEPADDFSDNDLKALKLALDDLRRLGDADIRLNHTAGLN